MTAKQLKKKYIDFFIKRGHKLLPNVPLIPENDPTALFVSAGMHPLVPYLLGEPHPLGKRLCSVQRCLRTDDIEKVGNTAHHTFFEMLGNWSLGDYWKKEAIEWSWEFLTKKLNLDPKRISVSVFAGDKDSPRDEESAKIWRSLGIFSERIYFFPKENNWWGPVGETGPCGPDTEMFYDVTGKPHGPGCRPEDGCGRYFEIWNDVFMEYNKTAGGKYEPLKQKNVDTGMGVERTVAVLNGLDDNYQTELFSPIIQSIEVLSGEKYDKEENKKPMRIIADHLKAAVFLAQDGVEPSNKERGYVMRRLVRRAVVKMLQLGMTPLKDFPKISKEVIDIYKSEYFDQKSYYIIHAEIGEEIDAFLQTIHKGTKLLQTKPKIDGRLAFDLYQTYGFPLEITLELCEQWGRLINKVEIEKEFGIELKKHQKLSRTASAGMFRGGLADHSEIATKYHTATHLLNEALRQVLGSHVFQKGSNITAERLRFDFPNPRKLTEEELKNTEELVNQKIKENLPVKMEMMSFEKAKEMGAVAVFWKRYGDKVKVYKIGDFSIEVCGGPHVDFTGKLGKFKIIKEESAGAGIRRIYAQLE